MNTVLRLYLPLALCALLTWFISDWLTPAPQSPERPGNSHQPDSFSQAFTRTMMSETGKPLNRLQAESMLHFREDDSTELRKPVLEVFDETRPPWTIHSDTGVITAKGDNLFLGGQVHISRPAATGVLPLTINTRNLNIKIRTSFAETDQFAELISNRSRISGTGLRLHFGDHKKVRLLSHVRGKYEASQ